MTIMPGMVVANRDAILLCSAVVGARSWDRGADREASGVLHDWRDRAVEAVILKRLLRTDVTCPSPPRKHSPRGGPVIPESTRDALSQAASAKGCVHLSAPISMLTIRGPSNR